jgi:acyl-coenzyme A synthetase/AMP-(fatty) acid ligase
VVDEHGSALPDGEVGRLWIRGGTAALMYWQDDKKSKATFAGDLVMSGDLAERDSEGYFWYRGRADDLLKVGGIWVAPAEIERCVATHPDVAECAVVGTEQNGLTRSSAYVVLHPGAVLSAEALQAFTRERLAPHKIPRDVHFVAALPKTGSGKIDRRALRETAMLDSGGTQS